VRAAVPSDGEILFECDFSLIDINMQELRWYVLCPPPPEKVKKVTKHVTYSRWKLFKAARLGPESAVSPLQAYTSDCQCLNCEKKKWRNAGIGAKGARQRRQTNAEGVRIEAP